MNRKTISRTGATKNLSDSASRGLASLLALTILSFTTTPSLSSAAEMSWDLGAATGSYGGSSYTEANLGLNWFLLDYLNWRNALFGRFVSGADNVFGLDSSLRLQTFLSTESGGLGVGFFAGPGYRFARSDYSAAFLEGGVQFKLGGLRIGGGVKQFYYSNPGLDVLGNRLPNTDTVYFIILSGGGVL
ncbi:MAG: hypothetical protein C5B49_04180 [Bdellovibrio sp.]|nr:MAG: hypothetical protein C5B49_04180 [Bdellovibrio sp.]